MPQQDIDKILDQLLTLPEETECVEFKTKDDKFNLDELGKYFSALSNEANLKGKACGWLVYGVDNDLNVVGTDIKRNPGSLNALKHAVSQKTTGRLTFIEIHKVDHPKGRVVMFEIPPAPRGMPIAWRGHYYGRDHDFLVALNIRKIEQIRSQSPNNDWSAEICKGASLEALAPEAIERARELYKEKKPNLATEVDRWDDAQFLNRIGLAKQGNPTNAAIILLGRHESVSFLSTGVVRVSWILKDEHGVEQAYEHFGPPFLLQVNAIFAKLRNLTVRQLPEGTLFPREIKQYDPWVVREALHNCIAHQDYSMNHRISVVEKAGEVIFENAGAFLPGNIESLLTGDTPPPFYRNQYLANAMVELNMIDTIGSGIRRMFIEQKKRSFPLPDYDLTDLNKVTVRISGRILDENYTKLLLKHENLALQTVILLDRVQKGLKLTKVEHAKLKKLGWVEGRYPNLFVSSEIAVATKQKADYIKNRPFDNDSYKTWILSFIEKFGSASRSDIDGLLTDKLSDTLDERQKKTKVSNLLQSMSKQDRTIVNAGSRKIPKWVLAGGPNDQRDSS